jgi:shikimate kinase
MQAREPLYREIADIVINTDGKHVKDVVREILGKLEQK